MVGSLVVVVYEWDDVALVVTEHISSGSFEHWTSPGDAVVIYRVS